MNWIKENKFLFGFLVVLALGVGAGGYFVFDARGRYDEAVGNYQKRVGELNRLQRLPIFPNQKNLEKIVAQQTDVNTEVSALASSLMAQQIPLEDVTPEQFQDRLKAAVTAVKNKAAQSSPVVALPQKFFLGFDRYETAPPAKAGAAPLARELKAIEWLCDQLIDAKVAEIRTLNRDPIPGENDTGKSADKKPAPPAAKPVPGKPGEKVGPKYDVDKHRIELSFLADQARFRKFLDVVVNDKAQFFIPRLVTVKNEKPTAPPRGGATADAGAPAPPPPIAGATPPATGAAAAVPAAAATYIVGEEKVEVSLVLEMVDFHESTAK
jgi:hypothetical protein